MYATRCAKSQCAHSDRAMRAAQTGRLILCTHLWKSINVAVKNSVAAFILINEANQEEMAGFWANIYSYSWHAVDIQTFIYTNVLTLIFPDKMFMCCLSWISSDSFSFHRTVRLVCQPSAQIVDVSSRFHLLFLRIKHVAQANFEGQRIIRRFCNATHIFLRILIPSTLIETIQTRFINCTCNVTIAV